MPLIPDEEEFDGRFPPWAYQGDEGIELPEAQLSEDVGPTQAGPQEFETAAPQPWRPDDDSDGRQDQPRQKPESFVRNEPQASRRDPPMNHQQRMESRQALRMQQNNVPMGQEPVDGPPMDQQQRIEKREGFRRVQNQEKVAQSWKPPIFDQFQAVNVVAGMDDEVNLGESLEIAREDPVEQMESSMSLAEAAYQNSEVAGEQSRYLHNTMSRLRDTEVGFMTRNYV